MDIETKLQSFTKLPENWCYGEGVAIPQAVVDKTIEIRNRVDQKFAADVFPGLSGEVEISFYFNKDESLNVIVNPWGTFDIRKEKGIGFKFIDLIEPLDETDEATVIQFLDSIAVNND